MIVQCEECKKWFEDVYRSTICPHDAFPANDGLNNFVIHNDAYIGSTIPRLSTYPSVKEVLDEN